MCALRVLTILALCAPLAAADYFLYPNLFFTAGRSSNGRISSEVAAYVSLAYNDAQFVTASLSDLKIKHSAWSSHQRQAVGGVVLCTKSLRARLHYGRIEGKFDAMVGFYSYRDKADLFSGELLFRAGATDVGAGAVYFSGTGFKRQTVQTYTIRIGRDFARGLHLAAKPAFASLRDGRRLYSVLVKGSLFIRRALVLRGGFAAGERAYAFDNDLLTLFNQDETQRDLRFVQLDTRIWRDIWFSEEYLWTRFRGYDIRYLIMGLRCRFVL